MRSNLRHAALILLFISGLLLAGPMRLQSPKDSEPRVILRVDRNLTVKGTVEDESDEIIVIRDLRGELHSFSKAKIRQIVRLVDPEPDQTGIIVLFSGQTQEGVIIEDNFNEVVFEVDGIRSRLRRNFVDYVMLEPSFQEQYDFYKQRLTPEMHEQHFHLCQWLFQKQKYELAEKELEELLSRVDHPPARQQLTIVKAQLQLNRRSTPSRSDRVTSESTTEEESDQSTGLISTADMLPDHLLTREEVNLIRVMEIDFSTPPKIAIKPETVHRFIENHREDKRVPVSSEGQARLFRHAAKDPLKLLRLMFELKARDLYGEVEVLTEPRALNLFRQRIHNSWLINNCATTRCHGGLNAGRFFLHRKGYKDERVRYTNLLILDRLELDPQWPLINYQEPRDSLIIQHALPRDLARKPHPDVPGWKAAFSQGNRRLLEDAINWIQMMMNDPRPDYMIEYEPPKINVITTTDGNDQPDRPSR